MKNVWRSLPLALLFAACTSQQQVDTLVINAKIYTVDDAFTIAEAMAVKDGKILATGTTAKLQKKYTSGNVVNAEGKFVYPGFIDAHAHFAGYAIGLQTANLTGTKSWEEIIEIVKTFAASHPEGWIIGRGWDQNDWPVKQFPGNDILNQLFPDRPVILTRVDGHAAIANAKALETGGIKAGQQLTGGEIEVKNNRLTGILIDNAIGLVTSHIPEMSTEKYQQLVLEAQQNCFAMGLTTIDDCGLSYQEMEFLKNMQDKGDLKMRLYVMLSDSPANFDYLKKSGIIKTDRMHVRSFKVYGDGALGSRGASLLADYSDRPGYKGFLLSAPEHFDSVAAWISENNFQMCTHAIGDSGNRTILNVYEKYLQGKNDKRWRIEHAQVVHPNDFQLFGKNSIIPSVQPTHATSDMYWAEERLGSERVKGAYAFRQLLNENGWVALGTDFPVEDISPFATFLAASFRKDASGYPSTGYQTENALTPEQTLRGMTIWAAKSNFEENEKGSLEAGKWADFIILDKDLLTAGEKEILKIKVLNTFLAGEKVYGN